jgi:nucleotide-binding universal stress UspA family protein
MNILFRLEVVETTSSVVSTIIDYAEQENVHLVVIGTTGRSAFYKALLVGVASGIAANAKALS